jgi:hypothetical protein
MLTINDAIGEGRAVYVDLVGREIDILDGSCLCENELEDGAFRDTFCPVPVRFLLRKAQGRVQSCSWMASSKHF